MLYIAVAGATHHWLANRDTFSDTENDACASFVWPVFWVFYGSYRFLRPIALFAWGLGSWCFGLFERRKQAATLPKAQVVSKK